MTERESLGAEPFLAVAEATEIGRPIALRISRDKAHAAIYGDIYKLALAFAVLAAEIERRSA